MARVEHPSCIPGRKTETEAKHVKVHFRLEVEDDWPPASDWRQWAGKVIPPSQNCTIRLIVLRDNGSGADRQKVLNTFAELGVGGEGSGMVALDVPPEANLAKGQRFLDHGAVNE
ncbi:DUF4265 domain-containing protein [Streptomyces sp. NPDC090054]|uniref:DUF4265 domain-containing protein n=1 Tax=Streptomyces sp. NPDC090054 TaxID=3365933 RepID=UPI0037F301F6